MQREFIQYPGKGYLIPQTGGLRKIRMAPEEAVGMKKGDKAAGRVTRYEIADVKAISEPLIVSQREMANALDTSVETIKSWEAKRRKPTGLTTH